MDEQVVGKKTRKKGWAKNEERPQTVTKDFVPHLASNGQFLYNTKPRNMCPDLGFRKCELIQKARAERAGEECDGEEGPEGFWFCIPSFSSPSRSDLRNPRKSSRRSLIMDFHQRSQWKDFPNWGKLSSPSYFFTLKNNASVYIFMLKYFFPFVLFP